METNHRQEKFKKENRRKWQLKEMFENVKPFGMLIVQNKQYDTH